MSILVKDNICRLFFLVFTGWICVNCSKDVGVIEVDQPIKFSCKLDNLYTKTAMNGDNATFAALDKIGVFETLTGKSNVSYTYGSGSWTTSSPMYWLNYNSFHQFYAYYPYNLSNNGLSVSIPILSSQSVSTVPDSNRDMLTASLNQKKLTAVNLNFTHVFALLKFNVTFASSLLTLFSPGKIVVAGGNTSGSLSGAYGMFNTVNSISNITYGLSTGTFTYSPNNNTVFQQSITANFPSIVSGATTVYILAIPGTYTNPQPYAKFSIIPILPGLEIYSTNQSLSITTLQANTKYEYNVQVVKGILSKGDDISDMLKVNIIPII